MVWSWIAGVVEGFDVRCAEKRGRISWHQQCRARGAWLRVSDALE